MVSSFGLRPSSGDIQARVDRVVPEFQARCTDQGRPAAVCRSLARTARHLVAWLALRPGQVAELDIRDIEVFLRHDCDCPAAFRSELHGGARRQALQLLDFLIETGRAAVPAPIASGGRLVEECLGTLAAQLCSAVYMRRFRSICRHFMVWLYLSDLELREIDGAVLQRFLDHECACTHPRFYAWPAVFAGTPAAASQLARFGRFLVDRGVVADWHDPAPNGHGKVQLDDYLDWLRRHRGLREATLFNYERFLRGLLPQLGDSPDSYDAASVRAVILTRARSLSPGQIRNESTALRSYLRFLATQGRCRPGLAGAVPTISRKPAAELPRYVEEGTIEALIQSCEPSTPAGLRDRAILLLLARLALRSGEIAALHPGDIDWCQALVTVRGKSRHPAALPLPQEVGDALKDYLLRARPRCACETLFVQCRAPYAALSSAAVHSIVRRALQRTGIRCDGRPAVHMFRHSRATHLLRGGTSPEAVGALLRHRSLATTAHYARVDVPMLLEVAQPWPEDPS